MSAATIGIMSDTHDNLGAIRKAVDFFNSKRRVKLILHAGDFIAPFTVREFKKLNAKFIAVFGNNDGDRNHLRKNFLSAMGVELNDIQELTKGGKKFCLYHGTNEEIVNSLIERKKYDIFVRGHTHKAEITKRRGTLIINPGEVCGYLSGKMTVALLNLKTMKAEICEL
jgi:hypothetical protein